MAQRYQIIGNRSGTLAVSDDLEHASRIVGALMETRGEAGDWLDYWVRDENGGEYYWDGQWRTCFSAACFTEQAA